MFKRISVLLIGLMFVAACQQSPVDMPANSNKMDQAPQTLQTDIGKVKLVKHELYKMKALYKGELADTFFFNEKYIEEDKKKKIEIGDGDYGKSFVEFRKWALSESRVMQFGYAADSTVRCWVGAADMADGTRLNRKFKLRISFKSANLEGINLNDLRVFRYDPVADIWILVGGHAHKKKQYITVNSRYTGYYLIADCQGNTIGHEDRLAGSGAELEDQDLIPVNLNQISYKESFVSTFNYITFDKGGDLKIHYKAEDGSGIECKAELKIDKETISIDSELEMNIDKNALIGNVDVTFHPHGTTFSSPALLTVEARNIDLSGWDLERIALYYDNPETGEWEKMNVKEVKIKPDEGYVKIVEAELPHFSRYAMAYGW